MRIVSQLAIPAALVAITLSTGCSGAADGTRSPTGAKVDLTTSASLVGTWHQTGLVRGSSLGFTIATSTPSLGGTGAYAIEAGRSGKLAVTGNVGTDDVIHLDLVTDYGAQSHVDARLVDANSFAGDMKQGDAKSGNPVVHVVFVKE